MLMLFTKHSILKKEMVCISNQKKELKSGS
jgi:hypothetical protein